MWFIFLLIGALVGAAVFGALSSHHPGGIAEKVLIGVSVLFPVLVAAGVWVSHQIARYNGYLSGTSSEGRFVVLVVFAGSVLLLPFSIILMFLGRKVERYLRY